MFHIRNLYLFPEHQENPPTAFRAVVFTSRHTNGRQNSYLLLSRRGKLKTDNCFIFASFTVVILFIAWCRAVPTPRDVDWPLECRANGHICLSAGGTLASNVYLSADGMTER